MANFEYIALDAKGEETTGTISASDEADAISQLRRSGLYPTQVAAEGRGGVSGTAKRRAKKAQKTRSAARGGGKGGKVKSKVLMIFTRQLATLVDAGLPLLRGLTVLGNQEKNKVMQRTINTLADSVQSGSTFSEGLGQHPRIFDKLYVNMVKAGELGGVLELVLERLAEYQEKAQKLKNRIVAAMVYPIIVIVIAMAILIFLMAFIVPKFEKIFEEMLQGRPLPKVTQLVIDASRWIQGSWLWLLLGFVVVYALWKVFAASRGGRVLIDRWLLKMPLIGPIQLKSGISRFSRTLGTLVTSGVPILQALNITRETAGNVVISKAIDKVHEAVREGESVVAPLEASRIFPPMVISMVDVGEETGQLPDMLLKVADVYDDEVDNAVEALTSMLEPIMIVFLALIVGTIVIALFLPMVDIIQGLQEGG
ncbi:MAG: type II secretion system F family protein [Verrucomicrobiae bacterium]|nr:type II secretion system F family protein [Verrucomicrobiae bacterium]MCP5541508.1 type II secretion system F family protein [Akkermansiaceae bacterium]MCP5551458.1 type II secretion system F family protein [Akkermansiaceae bacterium]